MIIAKRDTDGDLWINLGDGRWAEAEEVMRGKKYADVYAFTEEEAERRFGPFTIEWESKP